MKNSSGIRGISMAKSKNKLRKRITICTKDEGDEAREIVSKGFAFPFEKLSIWIASLSLLISMLSFIFTIQPQANPFSDNALEKANAGDIDSQLFLANLHYEIGNVGESIKWYSTVISHSGDHQAKAINNLAVIYLTNSQFYITRQDNELDAMKMFMVSAKLGEIDAAKNLYLLLISSPKELFLDQYAPALQFAETELKKAEIDFENLSSNIKIWEFFTTVEGQFIPEDDGIYRQSCAKTEFVFPDGDTSKAPVAKHTYDIYRKVDGVDYPEYFYCDVSPLENIFS